VYSGIASLLSPRPWLLTSASPRSIVSVSGTTNLLFPPVHLHCVIQILVFNGIKTIVTDMKDNIRLYKLPLGPSTDLETHISLAFGSDNIISISLYHDPWAVCLIYLLTGYEGIASLLSPRHWLLNEDALNWLIDWFIVFNSTFSNISAISWRPVLVVEEAGVPGENHRPWTNNW
jgi:hypothetical protein